MGTVVRDATPLRGAAVIFVVAVGGILFGPGPTVAQDAMGDADAGQRIFRQCASCHSFDPAARRPGPHLDGVFGRSAGSVEGFRYSQALQESGVVWDDETLGRYLLDPRGTVPGTRKAVGLRNEADLHDLFAYIRREGG